MKPRLLHPPCLLQQGGLFFLFVLLLSATSSAQNEDPYLIDPEKRTSASTPIPAGIIINLTYPVWGTAIESRTDQSVDIESFCDTTFTVTLMAGNWATYIRCMVTDS